MDKLLYSILKSITNPMFIIAVSICILLKVFYPKLRGYMGEFWVKRELKRLPKKEYLVLNDIMLETTNGTHQIDHIVVSRYGIFVIEMKNYYGKIIGDEYKDKWIQSFGKKKYYFKNPIYQNYGHVKALEEILKLDDSKFIPIVCFSNDARVKVKSKNIVVKLDDLLDKIVLLNTIKINDDLNILVDIIKKYNIVDRNRRKKHVDDIKNKLREENDKIENMICPKCGNKLVLKKGRYGTFTGCSNYPKCKYIKK